MILRCTFEELAALTAGARRLLHVAGEADEGDEGATRVAAPPEVLADVEALYPRLDGDLSIRTLEEQRSIERAVDHILNTFRDRMDALVLDQYVGSEDAVNAYFDFANVLTVHERVQAMGREMAAMIELMTGREATAEAAHDITFDD